MKHLPLIGFACLIALAGCSPKTEELPESEEKQTASAHQNPAVGMLVSKGHQITIHTSPEGPLYSVKDSNGKRLASEITKEQLQASFPDLNVSEIWAEASAATLKFGKEATPPLAD